MGVAAKISDVEAASVLSFRRLGNVRTRITQRKCAIRRIVDDGKLARFSVAQLPLFNSGCHCFLTGAAGFAGAGW